MSRHLKHVMPAHHLHWHHKTSTHKRKTTSSRRKTTTSRKKTTHSR